MFQEHLWYQQTSQSAAERASAFAAAGVLTASNWDPSKESPEERLDAIIHGAGVSPLHWKLPAASVFPHLSGISERRLAGTWHRGFDRYSGARHRAARLIIDMQSLIHMGRRSSLTGAVKAVSQLLAAPTIERRSQTQYLEDLQAGDIASVAFAGFRQAYSHEWAWPMRVGLLPPRPRGEIDPLAQVRAIERGLLDAHFEPPGRHDVFILTDPTLKAISALHGSPLGLGLVRTTLGRSTSWSSRLMRQWLSDDCSAPVAFFDLLPQFTGEFLNNFTYEMAHDYPLDVAVFGAYAQAWQGARATGYQLDITPPVLFAPAEETEVVFEDSRIMMRVDELIHRLDQLPKDLVVEAPPIPNPYALGITLGPRSTVGQIRDDLIRARSDNRLDFSQEAQGASVVSPLGVAVSRLENAVSSMSPLIFDGVTPEEIAGKPSPAPMQAAAANRFTDVALYAGHLFPTDDLSKETRIADDAPLVGGKDYTLEVAIRLRRTGIAAEQKADRPVLNPREDRGDLTVFVAVSSDCPGITFEQAFSSLMWPYNADSGSALFRMKSEALPRKGRNEGTIEIQLYHRSLDLLDTVEVSIIMVSERSVPATLSARTLTWPGKLVGLPRVELNSPERLASIKISSVAGGYQFDFKFRDRRKKEVIVHIVRNIGIVDLQSLLERVRDFWTNLVIGSYSETLTVSSTLFQEYLRNLVDIGRSAARLLFGNKIGPLEEGGETIARLLSEMERTESDLLQVHYSSNAAGFVFPWNLVYLPLNPKVALDWRNFWGTRYQIEQVSDGPKQDWLNDDPIEITFAIDPNFGDSQAQMKLLAGYQEASKGKVKVSQPIQQDTDLFTALAAQPCSHLYYFFCHGWAPHGGGALPADSLQRIKRLVGKLDEKAQKTWHTLLSLLPKMGKQPWIFIGSSEIPLDKLEGQAFFQPRRRPIIFLNMCQSAALLPSMTSGLTQLFLNRSASAVIGTESPMSPVFAHAFAKQVLDRLVTGDHDVGTALRSARHHFLDDNIRNPLGLAYTLYGRATARVGTEAGAEMGGNND